MKFKIENSAHGTGVFASDSLNKGEFIMDFKGSYYRKKELPDPYDEVDDHYLQIDQDLYLGPSGKEDDFLNHSCDPNAAIFIKENRAALYAIKQINKGDEITWDYSTSMNEDEWEMKCSCNSSKCRKIIKDFKYLPKSIQDEYIKLGNLAPYILDSLQS